MFKWLVGLTLSLCVLVATYDVGKRAGRVEGRDAALKEVVEKQKEEVLNSVLGPDKSQRLKNINEFADVFVVEADLLVSALKEKSAKLNPGEENDLHKEIISRLESSSAKMVLSQGFASGGLATDPKSPLYEDFLKDAERLFYEGYLEMLSCNELVGRVLDLGN